MQELKYIISNTTEQLTTGLNKLKPIVTTDNCNAQEADQIFNMLPELVNPQYKAWYCREFYRLPRTKIMELASLAKSDGSDPQRLFSFLLKRA
jgi:hypothetical protein